MKRRRRRGGSGTGGNNGEEPGGESPGGGVPSNSSSQHTIETMPVTDPSGIVYEGIIENPVEGAVVTIYSYDSETGLPAMHDDSLYLN